MRWTPDIRKCSDVSKPQQMLLVCILCVINAYLAMVRKQECCELSEQGVRFQIQGNNYLVL